MYRSIFSLCFIIITIVAISGCSSSSSSPTFRANVDVNGNVDGSENVEDFANNVKNKKEGILEITSTTIEGEKVTSQYEYNGKNIKYSIISPENNDKPTICSSVSKEETNNKQVYYLDNCDVKKRLTLIEIKK
jgi:uncharacterized lipoprotein YehR (DUF1307 family)